MVPGLVYVLDDEGRRILIGRMTKSPELFSATLVPANVRPELPGSFE